MTRVLVIESTYETCRDAVDKAFDAFPLDIRGKTVMVKVNAIKAGDPDTTAIVTNYRLLRAVLDRLESMAPARIIVGDSVGTQSYGNSEHVFEATRLKETAGEHYMNINKDLVLVPLERPFKRMAAVSRDLLEADVYISLPKMKTHGLTMISGGIKNNFGLLSGAQKSWYHYHSVRPEIFAEILLEMYRVRPPDLIIMDAVVAMEGYGPVSTEMRHVGKILASDDAVALDTVQAKIIGFEIDDVPTLKLARERGVGETRLAAIEVIGEAETIAEYHRPEPSPLSYCYRAGIGSGSTSIDFFRERVAMRPVIDVEKCPEGCSVCVDVCPTKALTRDGERWSVAVFGCLLCCACKEACDCGALDMVPDEGLTGILPGLS